jgi:hypothetical protein
VRTTLAHAALLGVLVCLPVEARAAEPSRPATGLTIAPSLGGGTEIGTSDAEGVAEVEILAGWEAGLVRPELGLVLQVAPGTSAALRPGVRYLFPDAPFQLRGALDWSHASGSWAFRWLLVGGAAELRLTSVLGAFAGADLGIPFTADAGLGLLVRAGFAFRF